MTTVREHIDTIVRRARSEHFEDDIVSFFEQELLRLYVVNPSLVLSTFVDALESEHGETLGEGIKILSRIDDRNTSYMRRRFIHDHVYHEEICVRAAALSAIEILEDSRSILVLKEYIEWEQVGWLKRYAEQVLIEFLSGIDEEMIQAHKEINIPVIRETQPTSFVTGITEAIGISLTTDLVIPIPGRSPVINLINSQEKQ